jgi:DNA-binding transcriptional LysR family regulator
MMITERMTAETAEARLKHRFGLSAQGQLRALAKSETQKCQHYAKAESVNLRMIDLNLFRVFDAMMFYRSVSKASQILSVTPSAVSHALSRLRQSIGDELFIPSESGMQPTPRALRLASAVREGLGRLELALAGKQSAPTETLRTFRIGSTDYACMVVVPSLVKRLAKSAPNIDLRVLSSDRVDVVRRLVRGRVDLAIGLFNDVPVGIRRSTLLREDEVIAVRTGHPLTRGKVTKERLAEFPHVLVELSGTQENEADGFTHGQGVGRRLSIERAIQELQNGNMDAVSRAVVGVPNFTAVVPFLQLSDMVTTLPRRLGLWAAAHAPLALLDLPYKSKTVEIETLWDQSGDQDQGLRWLVNELAESIEEVG